MKNDLVKSELEQIARANRGLIRPEDVVEFAQDPNTALHNLFEWDDGEAAQRYRLWQARKIIRVRITLVQRMRTRLAVSLTPDRKRDGGGYRFTVAVMNNKDKRKQLLSDALAELEAFKRKYAGLVELAAVFAEIDKAVKNKK